MKEEALCKNKTGSKPEKKEQSQTNFIDEIRKAAEIAQNKTDFVYEPHSGLYYDSKTGYYYNAVNLYSLKKILNCSI